MSWLVLGGSGFVGSAVLRALHAAGVEAHAARAPRLSTERRTAADLVAEARSVQATDRSVRELRSVMDGHDVVVNAAGLATPSAAASPGLLGANALLPVLMALTATGSGASRFIHLSSAAVQGRARTLDETTDTHPFSPYSASKALGEQALTLAASGMDLLPSVIVRATSVQGEGRRTTAALARLARSPLASVAAPGTAPTPVTSVETLAELVLTLGRCGDPLPPLVLQPWEGLTVRSVLEAAGGRPRTLPSVLCRSAVRSGYAFSRVLGGRLDGQVRRAELMWFGQAQVPGWVVENGLVPEPRIRDVLAAAALR